MMRVQMQKKAGSRFHAKPAFPQHEMIRSYFLSPKRSEIRFTFLSAA